MKSSVDSVAPCATKPVKRTHVLALSLNDQERDALRRLVFKYGFASQSEVLRYLIRITDEKKP
jgi:Arc/MetJ-type ribon-helix-helix transcriptional regulator